MCDINSIIVFHVIIGSFRVPTESPLRGLRINFDNFYTRKEFVTNIFHVTRP